MLALLSALVWFGWNLSDRLARVETDVAAIKMYLLDTRAER
jgi:hypothetical protein